jgi:hypothetical protein
MTQLDQHTREALCALDHPPPGVEDRLLAAILQATGGGGDGGGDGDGDGGGDGGGSQLPVGGESALAYAAKVVGATLGLTAAGFALVAVSAVGVRSLRGTPERAATAVTSSANVAAPSTDSTPEIPATSAPEPEAGSDELEHEVDEGGPDPASAREPSGASKSALAPSPAPTLEAELALLDVARSAAPRAALAALEQHRVEFEHGMLADEREVLRVETLCALGRMSEAEAVAASFLTARPSSPLRSRIEAACKS